jgi:hypothetical protein
MEPTTIFLHIPKTAGTTLYRIIERNYASDDIYTFWKDGSPDEFKNLEEDLRSRIRLLRGHVGFGMHEFIAGSAKYFTVLRDPIDRTISYYHFIHRTPHHYCHDLIASQKMSLEEFLLSKCDPMADNAQTRLLGGLETGQELEFGACTQSLLEKAKWNLRKRMDVIGITEKFDHTLLLLQQAFGWRRLFYVRQNVSSNRVSRKDLQHSTMDVLTEANLLDADLYQYARQLFEEQVQRRGESFPKRLDSFQQVNTRLRPFLSIRSAIQKISVRTFVKRQLDHIGRSGHTPVTDRN